jgi:Pyridoxamine 5'-phosphate oxidase
MTELDLYTFITKHKLGVLGTICQGGTPQSALVGIAITLQLEIIFDTVSTSRKYPNLISRPACSLVIGGWALANRPSNTKARLNTSRRRH